MQSGEYDGRAEDLIIAKYFNDDKDISTGRELFDYLYCIEGTSRSVVSNSRELRLASNIKHQTDRLKSLNECWPGAEGRPDLVPDFVKGVFNPFKFNSSRRRCDYGFEQRSLFLDCLVQFNFTLAREVLEKFSSSFNEYPNIQLLALFDTALYIEDSVSQDGLRLLKQLILERQLSDDWLSSLLSYCLSPEYTDSDKVDKFINYIQTKSERLPAEQQFLGPILVEVVELCRPYASEQDCYMQLSELCQALGAQPDSFEQVRFYGTPVPDRFIVDAGEDLNQVISNFLSCVNFAYLPQVVGHIRHLLSNDQRTLRELLSWTSVQKSHYFRRELSELMWRFQTAILSAGSRPLLKLSAANICILQDQGLNPCQFYEQANLTHAQKTPRQRADYALRQLIGGSDHHPVFPILDPGFGSHGSDLAYKNLLLQFGSDLLIDALVGLNAGAFREYRVHGSLSELTCEFEQMGAHIKGAIISDYLLSTSSRSFLLDPRLTQTRDEIFGRICADMSKDPIDQNCTAMIVKSRLESSDDAEAVAIFMSELADYIRQSKLVAFPAWFYEWLDYVASPPINAALMLEACVGNIEQGFRPVGEGIGFINNSNHSPEGLGLLNCSGSSTCPKDKVMPGSGGINHRLASFFICLRPRHRLKVAQHIFFLLQEHGVDYKLLLTGKVSAISRELGQKLSDLMWYCAHNGYEDSQGQNHGGAWPSSFLNDDLVLNEFCYSFDIGKFYLVLSQTRSNFTVEKCLNSIGEPVDAWAKVLSDSEGSCTDIVRDEHLLAAQVLTARWGLWLRANITAIKIKLGSRDNRVSAGSADDILPVAETLMLACPRHVFLKILFSGLYLSTERVIKYGDMLHGEAQFNFTSCLSPIDEVVRRVIFGFEESEAALAEAEDVDLHDIAHYLEVAKRIEVDKRDYLFCRMTSANDLSHANNAHHDGMSLANCRLIVLKAARAQLNRRSCELLSGNRSQSNVIWEDIRAASTLFGGIGFGPISSGDNDLQHETIERLLGDLNSSDRKEFDKIQARMIINKEPFATLLPPGVEEAIVNVSNDENEQKLLDAVWLISAAGRGGGSKALMHCLQDCRPILVEASENGSLYQFIQKIISQEQSLTQTRAWICLYLIGQLSNISKHDQRGLALAVIRQTADQEDKKSFASSLIGRVFSEPNGVLDLSYLAQTDSSTSYVVHYNGHQRRISRSFYQALAALDPSAVSRNREEHVSLGSWVLDTCLTLGKQNKILMKAYALLDTVMARCSAAPNQNMAVEFEDSDTKCRCFLSQLQRIAADKSSSQKQKRDAIKQVFAESAITNLDPSERNNLINGILIGVGVKSEQHVSGSFMPYGFAGSLRSLNQADGWLFGTATSYGVSVDGEAPVGLTATVHSLLRSLNGNNNALDQIGVSLSAPSCCPFFGRYSLEGAAADLSHESSPDTSSNFLAG